MTLSGRNGSSIRVSLRGQDQAELNSREAYLRSQAAGLDFTWTGSARFESRLKLMGDALEHVKRWGSQTRRATFEQLAVLIRDLLPDTYNGSGGLDWNAYDHDNKLVAKYGALIRNGTLTPAYKFNGKVYFVE